MKYECHITIDPVTGADLDVFDDLCRGYHFKVARLIKDNGQPNDRDQFATGNGTTYAELRKRMVDLCQDIKACGFKLRRYKIEEIVTDSRINDIEGLL